jgi:putative ABC transport system substrate-binding protein
MGLGVVTLALILIVQLTAAEAQRAGNPPRVGYVAVWPRECPLTPRVEAFLQGLRDLGYVHGQTIIIERRCYMADDQLHRILSEFARLKVDVILAESPEQARPARTAIKDIPIVCAACGDPVANGLVESLARPGGNVTGLATLSAELVGKRLELLKEAIPSRTWRP